MMRKRLLRLTFISLLLVFVLISSLVLFVGYSFYFSPLPQTSGVKSVEGLQAPVTVYRDSWAIPQIYASNSDDLFFTQGYVHAQDRWWQMEISRYLGEGRLRDILSPNEAVLNADRWMLTLNLAEQAQTTWDNASPDTRRALESYSAGVNAYIQSRSVESLASEYGLVGLTGELDTLLIYLGRDVEIEAWQPYHSILLWDLFALSVTPNFWLEFDLALAIQRDDSRSLQKLIGSTPDLQTLPLNDDLLSRPAPELERLRQSMVGDLSPELMTALGFPPLVSGNLWLASGEVTASGAPLIANDLHLATEIPSIWYEMGLQCTAIQADCLYSVVGFSLAGVPGIVAGHNDQIAWGINPTRHQQPTLRLLELNPDDPTQYRYRDGWQSFQQTTITLVESDEVDVLPLEMTVNQSIYGPAISNPVNDTVLVSNWSQLDTNADTLGSLLALNRASNWPAFQNALRAWGYPALQIGYADVEGNIGLQLVGPVRDNDGTLIPFDQLPTQFNPSDGIIVDANQLPDDHTSGYWAMPWRVDRIDEQLVSQNNLSADSFVQLQGDQYNPYAVELMPYIQNLTFANPDLQVAQAWLDEWDFVHRSDSGQAMFFALFHDTLVRLTLEDELYETNHSLQDIAPALIYYLLPVELDSLWDRSVTPIVESRDDILQQAFALTYQQLVDEFGDDHTTWQWGDLHQVTFASRVIGQDALFGNNLALSSGLFPINQGKISIGGSTNSIYHTRYTFASPLFDELVDDLSLSIHTAPSYRVIIDVDDFNNSRAMLATGQSGHPASDNYNDMIAPWRTLEYHDLQWGLAEVRASSDKRLELEPIFQ